MAKIQAVVLVAAFCIAQTYSAVCPRFTAVTNLNLQEFVGTWNIQAITENFGVDPQLQCLRTEFRGNQWSEAPVYIDSFTDGVSTATGDLWYDYATATVLSLGAPGRWQLPFNNTVYEFSILNTDYVESALMAHCAVIDDVEVIRAFIATRSDQPVALSRIEYFLDLLQNAFGIDSSLWYLIPQGDVCGN